MSYAECVEPVNLYGKQRSHEMTPLIACSVGQASHSTSFHTSSKASVLRTL